MKKPKSSRLRDRLSELPESLIFHIFWFLPMRDVVRTTILSKHWRNLWTTTPCLNFDYYEIHDATDSVRNFINRALILWEGVKIQKFKIDFRDESFSSDFDFWVCFAVGKKVQELYVHSDTCACELYSVPQYLYSCSSLKVLSLIGCRLEINGNVQWNQLKSLTIDGEDISEIAINQVLCGSPQLEVFILSLVDSRENLSIRSSSLKILSIDKNLCDAGPWLDTELRIWTPNLETLEIRGVPYSKCLLMGVSSLTHATLGFYGPDRHPYQFFYENDFLGETLRQIFPTIQHVEKVTLSDWCIKVLGDMKKKELFSSSLNVKFLKLNYCSVEYEDIVGLLEVFPKLKMLVLRGDMQNHYQHVRESLKFDANLPKSFLLHLRTIEITWSQGHNSIFPFVKIVLKYASKLEKMVIRGVPPAPRSSSLFLASQKLLRMPRSSPTAKLIFCEY